MKKISRLFTSASAFMYLLASNVYATAWDTAGIEGSDAQAANEVIGKVATFVKPIAAIMVFGGVLLLIILPIVLAVTKSKNWWLMCIPAILIVIPFFALIASFLFTVE